MSYTYKNIICPCCSKTGKYQIDIWSNDGVLYIENDYIICNHCKERIYIGNSEVIVNIDARKPME